jgi:hypothetical protein
VWDAQKKLARSGSSGRCSRGGGGRRTRCHARTGGRASRRSRPRRIDRAWRHCGVRRPRRSGRRTDADRVQPS